MFLEQLEQPFKLDFLTKMGAYEIISLNFNKCKKKKTNSRLSEHFLPHPDYTFWEI